jgi:hypothetical protein
VSQKWGSPSSFTRTRPTIAAVPAASPARSRVRVRASRGFARGFGALCACAGFSRGARMVVTACACGALAGALPRGGPDDRAAAAFFLMRRRLLMADRNAPPGLG